MKQSEAAERRDSSQGAFKCLHRYTVCYLQWCRISESHLDSQRTHFLQDEILRGRGLRKAAVATLKRLYHHHKVEISRF